MKWVIAIETKGTNGEYIGLVSHPQRGVTPDVRIRAQNGRVENGS